MVAEAWVPQPERLARYVRPDEMHQAFNFDFLSSAWDAESYRRVISTTMAANEAVGAPTTWVMSNHDVVRHASRLGRADTSDTEGISERDPQPDNVVGLRRAKAATLMMLALPGSAYLYQGEELGLPEHTSVPDEVRQDPIWEGTKHQKVGRDGCRIPLPWVADAPGLGFGPSGRTWLPQPESYRALAVDQQVGVPGSTWTMYRDALRLRRQYGLGLGRLTWEDAPEHVVCFDNGEVRVMVNIGGDPVPLPDGEVLLASTELDGALPTDAAVWVHKPID